MGKTKPTRGTETIPNKAMHSRVSYLYQAASFFAAKSQTTDHIDETPKHSAEMPENSRTTSFNQVSKAAGLQALSNQLLSDLRIVVQKSQIRLSPAVKHSICKRCNTMLVGGSTSTSFIENKSKDGKKPWADLLINKCQNCGLERRFPLTTTRQKRRPARELAV